MPREKPAHDQIILYLSQSPKTKQFVTQLLILISLDKNLTDCLHDGKNLSNY